MSKETGLTKQQIIQELTRSPHGALEAFVPVGQRAAKQEPEFFAHLIAWNHQRGQIRDAKVALPVLALSSGVKVESVALGFQENALAHIASLDPRNLVRATQFAWQVKTPGAGRAIQRTIERYLREREANTTWWDRTAVQHRESMKTLYARFHVKPGAHADAVLFKSDYPRGSLFEAVAQLRSLPPSEAAMTVIQRRIPFLIAVGALGPRMKETDVVLALIQSMSPQELVNNTKMLERYGVTTVPALKAAFEAGLKKVATSKANTFKATRAAEALGSSTLAEKVRGAQEKQINSLKGVDGNWLVLGDKSPSMQTAIDASRHLSATLARMVRGKVHLVFFDGTPYKYIDATGKSYDEIRAATLGIAAGGSGTQISSGLRYAMEKGLEVDAVAIVSDGGENGSPLFATMYQKFCAHYGKEPPVYLYLLKGSSGDILTPNMQHAGFEMTTFDLRGGFDYYSLPNIVQTMRVQRYGLVDEIMETPLLTLDKVFAQAARA